MRIDRITLHDVLPDVFRQEPPAESQVWRSDAVFQRENLYVIEAASGTGKSSLCSYIYGWRTDYQGSIKFNDTDTRSLSTRQWVDIRRCHLAYLPQEMAIFPELTALENIEIKNRLTHHCSQAQIRDMLGMLGIAHKADVPAGKLSIGQQQRVAIIRALCQPFDFLLLDEPVSHLDAENNMIVADLVMRHAQENQAGIIATSVGNPLQLPQSAIRISL